MEISVETNFWDFLCKSLNNEGKKLNLENGYTIFSGNFQTSKEMFYHR